MAQPTQRLGFIGAGKLAGSVMRGLIRAKYCSPAAIIASEPNEETRRNFGAETGVEMTTSNLEVARAAEIVFIGTKPNMVLEVVREIALEVDNKLVVSLAAGVRLENMEPLAASARLMRAMTNTPSAVTEAASGIARGSRATDDDVQTLTELFESTGTIVEVPEKDIDTVTALAGSGPAFVYSVIQALAEGSVRCGMKPDDAKALAIQTVLGAAQLAKESGKPLAELITQVVTPGGTTAAGLAAMEKMRSLEGLAAAIEAATKRGQELARESS